MKHKFRFTKDTMKRLKDFIRRKEEPVQAEDAAAVSEPEKPGVTVHALTDVGKVRAINQDALVVDEGLMLFGVADGVFSNRNGIALSLLKNRQFQLSANDL